MIKTYVSDMDPGGVYFAEDVKAELEAARQEATCQYSGLLSVAAYAEDFDYHIGHS